MSEHLSCECYIALRESLTYGGRRDLIAIIGVLRYLDNLQIGVFDQEGVVASSIASEVVIIANYKLLDME